MMCLRIIARKAPFFGDERHEAPNGRRILLVSIAVKSSVASAMRLRRKFMQAARRLAEAPVRALDEEARGDLIEQISGEMIVDVPIHEKSLKFFAPSRLLQARAKGVLGKEPDMIAWIDGFPRDAVFWDIGANVGVFGIYAAVKLGVRVQAFEPAAANFYALSRNIALNELTASMRGYCLALSGVTRLGVLNSTSTAMGAALSQFGDVGAKSRYMDKKITTAHGMIGMTIDRFIELFDPPFPTHIKIDVDGLELPIIEGAHATLRDPRLNSVMLELSLSDSAERNAGMSLMARAGFRFVSHGEEQSVDTERAANHLFVR